MTFDRVRHDYNVSGRKAEAQRCALSPPRKGVVSPLWVARVAASRARMHTNLGSCIVQHRPLNKYGVTATQRGERALGSHTHRIIACCPSCAYILRGGSRWLSPDRVPLSILSTHHFTVLRYLSSSLAQKVETDHLAALHAAFAGVNLGPVAHHRVRHLR